MRRHGDCPGKNDKEQCLEEEEKEISSIWLDRKHQIMDWSDIENSND